MAAIASDLKERYGKTITYSDGRTGAEWTENSSQYIYLALQFHTNADDAGKINTKIDSTDYSSHLVPGATEYVTIYKVNPDGISVTCLDSGTGSKDERKKNGYQKLDDISSGWTAESIAGVNTIYMENAEANTNYVAVYFSEGGYMGYNLGLKEDAAYDSGNARITFNNTGSEYYKKSQAGANMFINKDKVYYKGENLAVTDVVPSDTQGEYTFIAWFDKVQKKGEEITYKQRLVTPGDNTTSQYARNGSAHTLDAIWSSITADPKDKLYDGTSLEPTYDITLVYDGLWQDENHDYPTQIDELGGLKMKPGASVAVEWYKNGKKLDSPPTDVGEYDVTFSVEVQAGGNGCPLIEKTISTKTTAQIYPRTIDLQSDSFTKVYDGTALTNGSAALVEDGTKGEEEKKKWADGEGANITFTGSQTEIGKSDNTFTYQLHPTTKAGNYTITPTYGTLEVKPRYRVEYYYDGKMDTSESQEHKTKDGSGGYYNVGETVTLPNEQAPAQKVKDGKTYTRYKLQNQELTLGNKDSDNVIRVYYVSEKLTISAQKVWNDNEDAQRIRPEEVTLTLEKQNSESRTWETVGSPLTLNESNHWSGTFAGEFDSLEDGQLIHYRVTEPNLPEGYTVEVSESGMAGFTVTNTLTKKDEPAAPDPTNSNKEEEPEQEETETESETETETASEESETETETAAEAVKTGDSAAPLVQFYLTLMCAALAAAVLTAKLRGKKTP